MEKFDKLGIVELKTNELIEIEGGWWQFIVGYLAGEVLDGIQDGLSRPCAVPCEVPCK